jgi:hypothetical protein
MRSAIRIPRRRECSTSMMRHRRVILSRVRRAPIPSLVPALWRERTCGCGDSGHPCGMSRMRSMLDVRAAMLRSRLAAPRATFHLHFAMANRSACRRVRRVARRRSTPPLRACTPLDCEHAGCGLPTDHRDMTGCGLPTDRPAQACTPHHRVPPTSWGRSCAVAPRADVRVRVVPGCGSRTPTRKRRCGVRWAWL